MPKRISSRSGSDNRWWSSWERFTSLRANVWLTILVVLALVAGVIVTITVQGQSIGAQAAYRPWWLPWTPGTSQTSTTPPGTPSIAFVPSYGGTPSTLTANRVAGFNFTSTAADGFIDHFTIDWGDGVAHNSNKCPASDSPKTCTVLSTHVYASTGSFTIKAKAVDESGRTSAEGQLQVSTSGAPNPDDALLQSHPDAPIITLDPSSDLRVGKPVKVKIVVKQPLIIYNDPAGKTRDKCKTAESVSIHWGDNNDEPISAPALLDGCPDNPRLRAVHTFNQGGIFLVRAWQIGPSTLVKLAPEGQLSLTIQGDPKSSVVCKDNAGLTNVLDASSPAATTVHSYDQDVVFGNFKVKADKEGWVTQMFVSSQVQSNIYSWDSDVRRISLMGDSGTLLGKYSFPSDPSYQNPGSGSESNFEQSNGSVGSTGPNSPIVSNALKIPITPLHFGAGETKVITIHAFMNSRAVNNNLRRLGLAGGQCYGGPNLFKSSPPYLWLNDPRYYQQSSPNLVYGNIMLISSDYNPASGGYNQRPCQWGAPDSQCTARYPRNRGISGGASGQQGSSMGQQSSGGN